MKKTRDDNLEQLFSKLPAEEMPAGLRANIMNSILAEKPRGWISSDAKGIIIAASVSLALIAGVWLLLAHFGVSLPTINIEQDVRAMFKTVDIGRYMAVIALALTALLLLVIEMLISRRINCKRLEKI